MNEFRLLNYHTVYSCTGDLVKKLSDEVCFGYVFHSGINEESTVTYEIVLYMGTKLSKDRQCSNACLFDKKGIRRHLKILKSMLNFSYRIMDDNNANYNRVRIRITISKCSLNFHRYALTWIRYLYEYPYNVLLRDAYELKKDPTFRFESVSNIFNVVLGSFCSDLRSVHQVPRNGLTSPLTISQLKAKLNRVGLLNDIYKVLNGNPTRISSKYGKYSIKDIEYWNKGFDKRKNIYLQNYKINKGIK